MAADVTTKLIIHGDASGATEAMDKATAAVGKTQTAVGGLDKSVLGLGGQFTSLSSIAALAGTALGGMGIAALASQLHEAGMSAERLRNSFEAATGGIKKGADAYAYARSEAQRLGLDLQSTADAYLKITASTKGTSLEGENTQRIFSSVAGASRALGLSGDQMSGALLAISQMMSKGTVQAEELRGQLGERLPGAFQIAARSMGVTTAELGKMLEGGKVMSDDFLPKFAAELEKTFPPSEKAMAGLTAETMRMKTAFYELKTTIMDSGGEGLATGTVSFVASMTNEITELIKVFDKAKAKGVWGTVIGGSAAAGAAYFSPLGPVGIAAGGIGGAAVGVAGAVGTARMSGAYDQYKTLPPLSKYDKSLIGGIDPNTGYMTDSLYRPNFSNRMRRPEEITDDFGVTLNRNTPYEAPKPGAKVHPKDLLLEQIMGYSRFMAAQSAEATKDWQDWNSDDNKRIAREEEERIKAEEERINNLISNNAMGARWNAIGMKNSQDSEKSLSGFIAMQAGTAGDPSANELDRINREQQAWEESWAMNTDNFEEYELRKTAIAEVYSTKRKQLEQQTTVQNLQQYGMYTANAATLANNLYTLLGKKNRAFFDIAKGINLANTAMNTAEAVMKAYAQTGIFGGPIAAGIVAAVGASQMAIIAAQQPDGSSSSGGSTGSSFTMPGQSPVTQPVSRDNGSGLTVNFTINGTTLSNPQELTRWTEDYLVPTIRDLKTRGVNA